MRYLFTQFSQLVDSSKLPHINVDNSDFLRSVLQIALGVIAALAVIYIIISAIRYSVSVGDPQATAKLRGSLIYAGVGLAVVVGAEAIVTFALGKL